MTNKDQNKRSDLEAMLVGQSVPVMRTKIRESEFPCSLLFNTAINRVKRHQRLMQVD